MTRAEMLWAITGELPAGWPLLSHAHSFYHLFYVSSGETTFLLDGAPYRIGANQAVIAAPQVLHEIPAESHTLLETLEIKFAVSDPVTARVLGNMGPVFFDTTGHMKHALQNIIYNWSVNDPVHQENSNIILNALLLSMQMTNEETNKQVSIYIDTTHYPELIQQIIRYIEENHTDQFSLEQLATCLGYNKRYLCTAFKQSAGITILDYLNHVRIRHAANCFYYNDVPISVIAQYVGFITPVHFTRVFKNLVGISPSIFRQVYSLRNIDISENRRLKTPQLSLYEQLLGEKILPLENAIVALKKIGSLALSQQK